MTWTTTPPTEPGYYWLASWQPPTHGHPERYAPWELCWTWTNPYGELVISGRCTVRAYPVSRIPSRSLWAGPLHPPGDLP